MSLRDERFDASPPNFRSLRERAPEGPWKIAQHFSAGTARTPPKRFHLDQRRTRHADVIEQASRMKKGQGTNKVGSLPRCSLAPERQDAAPMLSNKLHREAPAEAVDPVTAKLSKLIAPTQEGG